MEFQSNIPIYLQLIDMVKLQIVSGTLKPGEKLKSVRELAMEHGVNPNTMQKALCIIEEEGLLVTLSTQGWIVTEDLALIEKARVGCQRKQLDSFIARAKELSITKEQFIEYVEKGWNENEKDTADDY